MTKRQGGNFSCDSRDDEVDNDEFLFCIDDSDANKYENPFNYYIWRMENTQLDSNVLSTMWWKHRASASSHWAENYPGQRPILWWRYEPDFMFQELPPQQRRPAPGESKTDFLHKHGRLDLSELKVLGRPKRFSDWLKMQRGEKPTLKIVRGGKNAK